MASIQPTTTIEQPEISPAHSCILDGVPADERCEECQAKVVAVAAAWLRWRVGVAQLEA